MNTTSTMTSTIGGKFVCIAAAAILSFAASTHAQVLGGNGNLTGNLGGDLAGGAGGMGGSFTGGLRGSTEFGTSAIDQTRRASDRTLGHARSNVGQVRGTAGEKIDGAQSTAKSTASRTRHSASNRVGNGLDSAKQAADGTATIGGGVASSAQASETAEGMTTAASGSALGAGEIAHDSARAPYSSDMASNATSTVQQTIPSTPRGTAGPRNTAPSLSQDNKKPDSHAFKPLPNANADGGASADAKASRSKGSTQIDASADADGNARIPRH